MGFRLQDNLDKRRKELESLGNHKVFDDGNREERLWNVLENNATESFFYFARTYYPEYTTAPFADFHREMIEFVQTQSGEFHLFAAPPEHGKSIIFMIWKVFMAVRGLRHKHAQFAEDKGMASLNLTWVKNEFKLNPRILKDFGDLIDHQQSKDDVLVIKNVVKKGDLQTYTAFKPFGHQTTVKGWIFRQHRIDSVEFDDYEPIDKSRNKKLVDERIKYIYSEVYGRVAENGVMYWVHNNSRQGSAADQLHKDEMRENLYSHIYPAIVDGVPLWYQRYDLEYLNTRRRSVGNSVWQGDWMQQPIVEGKIFQQDWIKTYSELPSDLIMVSRIDPSLGSSATSDYKSIPVMGWSPSTKYYYLVQIWLRQATINRMVDASYQIYANFKDQLRSISIEKDFAQDLIYMPYYQQAVQRHGYRIPMTTHETGGVHKNDRIMKLESPLETGLILFPHNWKSDSDTHQLVMQLLAFDVSTTSNTDDGPDSLARCYKDLEAIAMSYQSRKKRPYHSLERSQEAIL